MERDIPDRPKGDATLSSQGTEKFGSKAFTALAVGLLLTGFAQGSKAQSYVRSPCPSGGVPRFEDHLQSLWYRRFWTGECKDLPVLGCRSGRPYWNDVISTITARAPANGRAAVSARACKLGREIGFEWTRPKTERRINTQDLQKLDRILEEAPDVTAGLRAVESSVRGKVGP